MSTSWNCNYLYLCFFTQPRSTVFWIECLYIFWQRNLYQSRKKDVEIFRPQTRKLQKRMSLQICGRSQSLLKRNIFMCLKWFQRWVFSPKSWKLAEIWECKQIFLKLGLNKVLGLPWFEIQTKFIVDYFNILGMFLDTNQHFCCISCILKCISSTMYDIDGGLKRSNHRTVI